MDYSEEDYGADLEEALKRSLAEPLKRPLNISAAALSNGLGASGTPTGTPLGEQQMLEPVLHRPWIVKNGGTGDADTGTVEQEYSLFKHHYFFPEEQNDKSASDLLNDLNIEISEQLGATTEFQSGSGDSAMATTSIQRSQHPRTKRRVSIQDSPWVRQMRNPRSSFSGSSTGYRYTAAHMTGHRSGSSSSSSNSNSGNSSDSHSYGNTPISSNEVSPLAADVNQHTDTDNYTNSSNRGYDCSDGNKCWVTILRDGSPESLRTVLVLNHSLVETRSKFPFYVVYDTTATEPKIQETMEQYGLSCIPVSKDNFVPREVQSEMGSTWLILSLFVFLADKFDVVCYIAPECVLTDNIDELLESDDICNEIDNETCVLLTNSTGNYGGNNNGGDNIRIDSGNDPLEPQLLLLRPNNEVAMCIKEYFTAYGDVKNGVSSAADNLRKKTCVMSDFDVLRELFSESWGEVSSEGYVWLLTEDYLLRLGLHLPKILDFRLLKPWDTSVVTAASTAANANSDNVRMSSSKHGSEDSNNVDNYAVENESTPITITMTDRWLQIWDDILRCAEG